MVNELLDELFDDRIDNPSLGAVFKTSRNIVIVGLCVFLFLLAIQIFSIVDQIQTGSKIWFVFDCTAATQLGICFEFQDNKR